PWRPIARQSTSSRHQRTFGIGADNAIDGEPFTLLEGANGAARRRIRDAMDRQLHAEHIIKRALHPTHILRADRHRVGRVWLESSAIRLKDHTPRPPRPREMRRVPWFSQRGNRSFSLSCRHYPRRARRKSARPGPVAKFFLELEAALL